MFTLIEFIYTYVKHKNNSDGKWCEYNFEMTLRSKILLQLSLKKVPLKIWTFRSIKEGRIFASAVFSSSMI